MRSGCNEPIVTAGRVAQRPPKPRAYNRCIASMQHPSPSARFDFRLAAALLLLGVAITFTWRTVDGLSARRKLRTELAELEHVRYGLLNADRWVERLVRFWMRRSMRSTSTPLKQRCAPWCKARST